MPNPYTIFDRNLIRKRHERAARLEADNFLIHEIADRLADRLSDFTRTFPQALDLGAYAGMMAKTLNGRGRIEKLTESTCDEELLTFAENSFDLILSVGSLHWVNDLPGVMIQIRQALKPDGLFMAMLPGGETLKELRESLEKAEQKVRAGVSPRVSPFLDVRDAGALLQRTGFAMPVADSETVTVTYEDPWVLLEDIRVNGEANALLSRDKHFTRKAIFFEAMNYYQQHFTNEDGRLPATVELVTMTGWKTIPKPA